MRVVSLVPSLTEAVAVTLPGLLVGATTYCTHPADLDVARVGGTKYPDVPAVLALRPDIVLMNIEENRRADADALEAADVRVRLTYPRTVSGALDELGGLLRDLGQPEEPGWLRAARAAWSATRPALSPRGAIVPVWRRPWVVAGGDTFASDVLHRLGLCNLYDTTDDRYPRPSLEEMRALKPDLIVLPDEPYPFAVGDGPEAFPGLACALISGRHLTWYGPSLAEAREILTAQLAEPVTAAGRK
ncbi:helical backbone metal receptor [Micromonospora sp. NPDC050397]|uniref:helical backbone metal receptor n=1 Tax=Micromonospora sp. NPDC050397 TaxID=3364279 RepID=UPI0038501B62